MHDKYMKVNFNQGPKFLYFDDKYAYDNAKKFYQMNKIPYEERHIQKNNTIENYRKSTTRLSGSSYYLIHNMRKNRLQDFEYSELMTDDELQDYILKGTVPDRIKKK